MLDTLRSVWFDLRPGAAEAGLARLRAPGDGRAGLIEPRPDRRADDGDDQAVELQPRDAGLTELVAARVSARAPASRAGRALWSQLGVQRRVCSFDRGDFGGGFRLDRAVALDDADGFLDQRPDMGGRENLPTPGHTDLLVSTRRDDLPRCSHEQSYPCVIGGSNRSSDELHKVHLYQIGLVVLSRCSSGSAPVPCVRPDAALLRPHHHCAAAVDPELPVEA